MQFPHCDSAILHAPFRRDLSIATLWSIDDRWTLSFHQIDRVPDLLAAAFTSRGGFVRSSTPPLVILLTEPASHALVCLSTENQSGASDFACASETGLNIVLDVVQPASVSGDSTIYQPLSDELNWRPCRGAELPLAEPTFARSGLALARIVIPAFRGGSWSLTIGTAGRGWMTLRSPVLSDKPTLNALGLKSPSAILSALTAIRTELTNERWQQEQLRRSSGECEHCDQHPDWQNLRVAWDIAFTGHEPVGDQTICPAERRRPIEKIERWGGNVPTRGQPVDKIIEGLRELIEELRAA